jgi:putative membrane protein
VPTTVGAKQQKEIAKLQKLHGGSFDKEFATMMVRDHKAAINRFEKASNDVDIKDPALNSFARGTVPALEHHLGMAHGVKALVKTQK